MIKSDVWTSRLSIPMNPLSEFQKEKKNPICSSCAYLVIWYEKNIFLQFDDDDNGKKWWNNNSHITKSNSSYEKSQEENVAKTSTPLPIRASGKAFIAFHLIETLCDL